jgi:hypothetical protein
MASTAQIAQFALDRPCRSRPRSATTVLFHDRILPGTRISQSIENAVSLELNIRHRMQVRRLNLLGI